MSKGKITNTERARMRKAILEIIEKRGDKVNDDNGKPIINKIVDLLNTSEYGFHTTKTTVSKIIRSGALDDIKLDASVTNKKIREMDVAIATLQDIYLSDETSNSDKTKALVAYNQLIKTKIQYESQLMESQLKLKEAERPIYQIRFGGYKSVKRKCPQCGHEYYDVLKKENAVGESDVGETTKETQ